jgi:hypothetical protein
MVRGLSHDAPAAHAAIKHFASQFYDSPSSEHAARLLEAALYSPHDIVTVAAASSYFDLTIESEEPVAILTSRMRSVDVLAAEMATLRLTQIDPTNPSLRHFVGPSSSGQLQISKAGSLLVHGTRRLLLGGPEWWEPKGGFHTYVQGEVWKDLYADIDFFAWSGAYWPDKKRSDAASELAAWLKSHNADRPNIMGHSHGGNVAILASHMAGIKIGTLVLLSCPVHVPKYLPNFSAIDRVVSIHVTNDSVIDLDGGGQRYDHREIEEVVLPIIDEHSATHDPDVWRKYEISKLLRRNL